MADYPPPPPPPDRAALAAGRAARLERLAQRPRAGAGDEAAAPAAPRQRRKHPAKGARAAALGLSLTATAGLAALFAMMSRPAAAETAAVIVTGGSGSPTVAAPPPSTPTTAGTATTAASGQPARPTVVDGAVFRNKWGPVQVEATFASDGTLTDVAALRTPDNRGQSIRINDYAVPRLTSEALTSQSASVDTISGATYTSEGYRRSLQSAIDLAREAGVTALA